MHVKRKIYYLILWLFGALWSLGMALTPWFVFETPKITYHALLLFFFIWDLPLLVMSVYLFSLALPVIDLSVNSDALIIIKKVLGLKIKKEYFHIRGIYYCRKLHRGRHNSFPVDTIYIEEADKKRTPLINSMTAENIDDIYNWLEDNFHTICIDERGIQIS